MNALAGGTNLLAVQLATDVRQEAYNKMVDEAVARGANAIIGMSYGTAEIGAMCYGTAVVVKKRDETFCGDGVLTCK